MTIVLQFLLTTAILVSLTARVVFLYPEVKIDPASGTTIPEGYAIAQIPKSLHLPMREGTAYLATLPGQIATFQMVAPPSASPIILQATPSVTIQVFAVGLVNATEDLPGEYPDLLIPLSLQKKDGYLEIPTSKVLPEQRLFDLYWIEIKGITAPTSLTITRGNQQYQLTVWPISEQISPLPFLLNFNEYGDKYLRPFKQSSASFSKLLKIEQNIFQELFNHQGYLNPLPYKSQKGTLRKGMGPRLLNNDLLHPQLDWKEFDQRFGPLLDGSAFPDGKPIPYFYLPFNPNWPAPFELYFSDRQKYEAIWFAFAQAFIRHFKEKNWTQTRFQVYMNQKPSPNNKIPWHLDEPKGVEDYKALRYFGSLTHRVFQNADPIKIDFRIDISHFFCAKHRGNPDKDFRVNGGFEILKPVVDTWVISIHSLQSITARLHARELLAAGKSVWVYGNTPTVMAAGFAAYQDIFLTIREGWQSMLIWKTFNFSQKVRNGKSCIAYILPNFPNSPFIPSIRLKLLREGVYLHALMQTMVNKQWLTPAQQETILSILSQNSLPLTQWATIRQLLNNVILAHIF